MIPQTRHSHAHTHAHTNATHFAPAFIPASLCAPSSSKAPKPNYGPRWPTNEHLNPDDTRKLTTHLNNILEKHKKGYYDKCPDSFVKDLGNLELFRTKRAGCPTLLLKILDGKVPLDDPQMRLLLGMCPKILRSGQTADMSTSDAYTGDVMNAGYE